MQGAQAVGVGVGHVRECTCVASGALSAGAAVRQTVSVPCTQA